MRLIIPMWGAFAGFLVGASAVEALTDEGFLRSVLAWLVAVALALVFGAMLFVGAVDAVDLGSGATTERLDDDWWWYALYVALAIAGVIVQLRYAASVRASLRAEWSAAGGRHLRPTGAA